MTQKQLDLSVMLLAAVTIMTAGGALFFPNNGKLWLAFTFLSLGVQTVFYAYQFMLKQWKKRGIAISFVGGFSIGLSMLVIFF